MNSKGSKVLFKNPAFCKDCISSSYTYVKEGKQSAPCNTCSLRSCKTGTYTETKSHVDMNKLDRTACPELDSENYQFPRKCYQYKSLLLRVRSLLDEIRAIKKNETIGTCDFCKRYNSMSVCKRCQVVAKKLGICTGDNVQQEQFNMWLCKLKQFLYTILEREVCQHKLYHKDTFDKDELTNLLNQLKVPLDTRKPFICHFLCMETIENLTESKDILEEVLVKLNTADHYFSSRTEKIPLNEPFKRSDETVLKAIENVAPIKNDTRVQEIKNAAPIKKDTTVQVTNIQKPKKEGEKVIPKPKPTAKPKGKSRARSESTFDTLLTKLAKEAKPRTEKPPKPEKLPVIPIMKELPIPKRKPPRKVVDEPYEGIVECELTNIEPEEVVQGDEIVPYKAHPVSQTDSVVPMLYKVNFNIPDEVEEEIKSECKMSVSSVSEKTKRRPDKDAKSDAKLSVVTYKLSNSKFIEKGWTLLPTTKVMRKINIYKMVPASPQPDWFKKHKNHGVVMYDTGERFADVDDTGDGKWYYKNGRLALHYYKWQEPTSGFRYIIYSSGETNEFGKNFPVTVLATFDHLGNGVVYDNIGNERLKYNQSEGMVIDEKIGSPGRWMWHSLNEPPVLVHVFTDNYVETDRCFELRKIKMDDDKSESSKRTKVPDEDMLTIELQNLLKEKSHKLMQKFKPFKIKTKALKLNEQFSLNILEQSKIFLIFRDGRLSVKLNIGMRLMNDKIIDVDTVEVNEPSTPYDVFPPRSESIGDIQELVKKARNVEKSRVM